MLLAGSNAAAAQVPEDGKSLGTIFNNDINNVLWASSGKDTTPDEYKHAVLRILDLKPGVLAQNVGMPDPVIYRSWVATTWDKYHEQVTTAQWPETKPEDARRQAGCMRKLLDLGTDPLKITLEACRERDVLCVASYRMNAEDFYGSEPDFYDFGRAHKDWAIPGANCLDPAIPGVYKHRMAIFRELLGNYDVDGIEFDFRRWYHMISDPLNNHPTLTQMVRDTRRLLDASAKRKGRSKLLLGVRVGPMLEGEFRKEDFPGSYYGPPTNMSCEDPGLDVRTWIEEGLVDYVCPTIFGPLGLPRVREFADLARNTRVGVYPTLSCTPVWTHVSAPEPLEDSEEARRCHRDEACLEALQCYDDGADGVSLFNWFPHLFPVPGRTHRGWGREPEWPDTYRNSIGFGWVLQAVTPRLHSPELLREYMAQDELFPERG